MERTAFKTTSFKEAEKHDREQQLNMTANQRLAAARALQRRFYGDKVKDIRQCHPKN